MNKVEAAGTTIQKQEIRGRLLKALEGYADGKAVHMAFEVVNVKKAPGHGDAWEIRVTSELHKPENVERRRYGKAVALPTPTLYVRMTKEQALSISPGDVITITGLIDYFPSGTPGGMYAYNNGTRLFRFARGSTGNGSIYCTRYVCEVNGMRLASTFTDRSVGQQVVTELGKATLLNRH